MEEQKRLVINFFQEPDEMKFIKLWKLNSDIAMKCLFYILDQKKDYETFVDIFSGWVYKNQREVFFKNLSLILGIYNEKILTDDEMKKIIQKDYDDNETKLKELVEEEYRETFRKEFISRARLTYFTTVYQIPVYGTIKVVRLIQNKLKTEKLVYHTVEHLVKKYEMFNNISVPKPKTKFEEQYQFVTGIKELIN